MSSSVALGCLHEKRCISCCISCKWATGWGAKEGGCKRCWMHGVWFTCAYPATVLRIATSGQRPWHLPLVGLPSVCHRSDVAGHDSGLLGVATVGPGVDPAPGGGRTIVCDTKAPTEVVLISTETQSNAAEQCGRATGSEQVGQGSVQEASTSAHPPETRPPHVQTRTPTRSDTNPQPQMTI